MAETCVITQYDTSDIGYYRGFYNVSKLLHTQLKAWKAVCYYAPG